MAYIGASPYINCPICTPLCVDRYFDAPHCVDHCIDDRGLDSC